MTLLGLLSTWQARDETFLTHNESTVCGYWWLSSADTRGCDCASLRADTPARLTLKRGCERFAAWGWTTGDAALEYRHV